MPDPKSIEKDITLVTVAYKSAHMIEKPLRAYAALGCKVICVDNGNEPKIKDLCESLNIEYRTAGKNIGYGSGANLGFENCTTPYGILINPDATLTQQTLQAFLACAKNHPNAGIIGPKIMDDDGEVFFKNSSLLNPPNQDSTIHQTREIPTEATKVLNLSGACFFLDMDKFKTIQGFDKNIFLFYEDDDLCRRMRDNTFDLIFCPEAEIIHIGGTSAEPTPEMISFRYQCMVKSEIYVRKKFKLEPIPFTDVIKNLIKILRSLIFLDTKKSARYTGWIKGFYNK